MNPISLNEGAEAEVVNSGSAPLVNSAMPPEPSHPGERLWLLWWNRRLILRATLLGMLGSLVVALLVPAYYGATSRLMPPDNSSLSNLAMLASMGGKSDSSAGLLAADLLGMRSTGSLFVEVLKSRTLQDRLVYNFQLKEVYGASLMTDARRELASNTTISEDRKSGVIQITVYDKSPQRAALLANGYTAELNKLVAELNTSSAHRERVFIESRLKAVKQELDQAGKELSEFSSRNTAIDIKEQARAMLEAAAMLQGQMIAAQAELESMKQIYTEQNVRVRALRARIEELHRQLDKLGGSDADINGAPVTKAAADSGSASSRMAYPSIRKLPELGLKFAELYRRAKIQETVYDLLTQQYELAKVQEAKETPSVKILDVSEVPERKAYPSRLLILFLGTMLPLIGSTLWVVAKDRWKTVEADDSRKLLAMEIYGKARGRFVEWSSDGHGLGLLRKQFRRHKDNGRQHPGAGE